MPEQKTMEQYKEELDSQRRKKLDGIIVDAIRAFLIADLNVYDFHYVDQRARKIVEDAVKKIDIKNDAVLKARQAYLKAILAETRKNLEPEPKYNPKSGDATERRNARCEPVARELVDKMLTEEILLSDGDFLDKAIAYADEMLFTELWVAHFEGLYEGLIHSANVSLKLANTYHWGKEKEDITWRELDVMVRKQNAVDVANKLKQDAIDDKLDAQIKKDTEKGKK